MKLGIENASFAIEHPLVITESICNPNYSRRVMNELLFECYGFESVCWGVDSLFSLYNQYGNKTNKHITKIIT